MVFPVYLFLLLFSSPSLMSLVLGKEETKKGNEHDEPNHAFGTGTSEDNQEQMNVTTN